ncbi:DUF6221 family protein [Streptomyces sp. NPDC029003]|uniref:DUF6221 family protein n=1 Tax=Streptomyces sp. NPDC029003 TaxID=3155125 RepID=UPI0033E5D819
MRRNNLEAMMVFLKARLRDDETAARALKPGKNDGIARLQTRVLADAAAKRQLMHWVENHELNAWKAEGRGLNIWQKAVVDVATSIPLYLRSPVLYKLVAAYADHPDFEPEWLPMEDEQELEEDYVADTHDSSTRRRGRTI